jgi:hypothetical protein
MHYDFIEIGTSDFDSIVEKSAPEAVGICVEPVQFHLSALPDRPNVKKISQEGDNIELVLLS